ncbi:hypothetical protein WEH80_23410 [Actinomycetes bacterium KLBMP 9759]
MNPSGRVSAGKPAGSSAIAVTDGPDFVAASRRVFHELFADQPPLAMEKINTKIAVAAFGMPCRSSFVVLSLAPHQREEK